MTQKYAHSSRLLIALTVLLLFPEAITAQTGESRKLSLIVDLSQIRQSSSFETISNSILRLSYVKESTESGWHVRIRPQPGNPGKLLVEREGGAVIGRLSPADPKLTKKLLSLLETEAKWRIIRSLENLSGNSTIQIEVRAVPITVSLTGRVIDLPKNLRK